MLSTPSTRVDLAQASQYAGVPHGSHTPLTSFLLYRDGAAARRQSRGADAMRAESTENPDRLDDIEILLQASDFAALLN